MGEASDIVERVSPAAQDPTPRDRALFSYIENVVFAPGEITAAQFTELAALLGFSAHQMMELTWVICFNLAFSRFVDTLGL
jgi:alkylhydroperoxidase family enzyme